MFAAPRRFMCQVPEEEVIVPGEIIDESKPKEYSPKVQKIVDEIAELNLMEVTDLVDLLTVRRSRSFAHSLARASLARRRPAQLLRRAPHRGVCRQRLLPGLSSHLCPRPGGVLDEARESEAQRGDGGRVLFPGGRGTVDADEARVASGGGDCRAGDEFHGSPCFDPVEEPLPRALNWTRQTGARPGDSTLTRAPRFARFFSRC